MNYKQATIILMLGAIGAAGAFCPVHSSGTNRALSSIICNEQKHVFNDIEEMCLENVARFCLEEECPVGETDALIATFQEQREMLMARVSDLDDLVMKLKNSDATEIKDLDETQQRQVRSWFGAVVTKAAAL